MEKQARTLAAFRSVNVQTTSACSIKRRKRGSKRPSSIKAVGEAGGGLDGDPADPKAIRRFKREAEMLLTSSATRTATLDHPSSALDLRSRREGQYLKLMTAAIEDPLPLGSSRGRR